MTSTGKILSDWLGSTDTRVSPAMTQAAAPVTARIGVRLNRPQVAAATAGMASQRRPPMTNRAMAEGQDYQPGRALSPKPVILIRQMTRIMSAITPTSWNHSSPVGVLRRNGLAGCSRMTAHLPQILPWP